MGRGQVAAWPKLGGGGGVNSPVSLLRYSPLANRGDKIGIGGLTVTNLPVEGQMKGEGKQRSVPGLRSTPLSHARERINSGWLELGRITLRAIPSRPGDPSTPGRPGPTWGRSSRPSSRRPLGGSPGRPGAGRREGRRGRRPAPGESPRRRTPGTGHRPGAARPGRSWPGSTWRRGSSARHPGCQGRQSAPLPYHCFT